MSKWLVSGPHDTGLPYPRWGVVDEEGKTIIPPCMDDDTARLVSAAPRMMVDLAVAKIALEKADPPKHEHTASAKDAVVMAGLFLDASDEIDELRELLRDLQPIMDAAASNANQPGWEWVQELIDRRLRLIGEPVGEHHEQ